MRKARKKRVTVITFFLSIVIILLASCETKPSESNLQTIKEKIENIEFKKEKGFFEDYKYFQIDTEKKTYVWIRSDFIKCESRSKLIYDLDSENSDEQYNGRICLNEEDIKNYSKKYADTYGEPLSHLWS